jgi:anti-anti-sigma regulatory factor
MLTSLAAQGADLTVDVSQARLIDTGGSRVLAAAYRRVRASGGQLSLIGAGPS